MTIWLLVLLVALVIVSEAAAVDHDLVAAPIGMAPPPQRTDNAKPDAKADAGANCVGSEIRRRRDIHRRIILIGPIAVSLRGVVDRQIDHRRVDRLDDDVRSAAGDGNLRRRFEAPGGDGAVTQELDARHHLDLLVGESGAESLGPIEVIVHHHDDLWKRNQRFDARVPRQGLQRGGESVALERGVGRILQPFAGVDDLRGKSPPSTARSAADPDQRDRRQHLVELLPGKGSPDARRLSAAVASSRVGGAGCWAKTGGLAKRKGRVAASRRNRRCCMGPLMAPAASGKPTMPSRTAPTLHNSQLAPQP